MNFDFLKLKPEIFGLDISDRSLKLVKVNSKKDIVIFNEIAIEDSIIEKGEVQDVDTLAQKIKELISKTSGLKTKHVVVSLPEEKSFIRVMQLPKMPIQETKKAVLFEAENYIPFSIENVYFDSQILKNITSKKHTEVLLAALPKTTVDPYVEACKLANLIPVSFETESQATARAVIGGGRTKDPIFIVDIGATCSNFSVFQGDGLRFASFIPFSTIEYTQAIADAMKVNFKKAEELKKRHGLENIDGVGSKVFKALLNPVSDFVNHLSKHIDYYQSNSKQKITGPKLILCGGGANLKGLDSYLSDKMSVQAIKSDPLVNLNKSKIPEKQLLTYTTAIGLALRGND
jgi:type IV pilus assembly protein PilM